MQSAGALGNPPQAASGQKSSSPLGMSMFSAPGLYFLFIFHTVRLYAVTRRKSSSKTLNPGSSTVVVARAAIHSLKRWPGLCVEAREVPSAGDETNKRTDANTQVLYQVSKVQTRII